MKSIERRSLILMRWYEEQINKENTKIKIILPTTHVQKQRRKDFVTLIDSFYREQQHYCQHLIKLSFIHRSH